MEAEGIHTDSTRDESPDSLFEERTTRPHGSIEREQDIDMTSQDQEPVEETEITITAILEEINRSVSSKNSSMQEEVQIQQTMEGSEESNKTKTPSTSGEPKNSVSGQNVSEQPVSRNARLSSTQPTSRVEAQRSEAMLKRVTAMI